MLPTYAEVYKEISDRAQSALPPLTGVYRTQALNRQNWENLASDAKLAPPYLVIESGRVAPAAWAMDVPAHAHSVALYLVAKLTANAVEETAALMEALRDAFYGSPMATCSLMGQVPTIDVTEANPANLVFYSLQSARCAGMLSFDVVVGAGVYATLP